MKHIRVMNKGRLCVTLHHAGNLILYYFHLYYIIPLLTMFDSHNLQYRLLLWMKYLSFFSMTPFSPSISPRETGSERATRGPPRRSPARAGSASTQLFPISASYHVRSKWRLGFPRPTRPSLSFPAVTFFGLSLTTAFPSFSPRPLWANDLLSGLFPFSFISSPYFQFHLLLFPSFRLCYFFLPHDCFPHSYSHFFFPIFQSLSPPCHLIPLHPPPPISPISLPSLAVRTRGRNSTSGAAAVHRQARHVLGSDVSFGEPPSPGDALPRKASSGHRGSHPHPCSRPHSTHARPCLDLARCPFPVGGLFLFFVLCLCILVLKTCNGNSLAACLRGWPS